MSALFGRLGGSASSLSPKNDCEVGYRRSSSVIQKGGQACEPEAGNCSYGSALMLFFKQEEWNELSEDLMSEEWVPER